MSHLRVVSLDADLAEQAGRIAADRRLRGADAVYVALARRLEVSLVSWDAEQLERAHGLVEVARPEWTDATIQSPGLDRFRRVCIPKDGDESRPLGTSAFEDRHGNDQLRFLHR